MDSLIVWASLLNRNDVKQAAPDTITPAPINPVIRRTFAAVGESYSCEDIVQAKKQEPRACDIPRDILSLSTESLNSCCSAVKMIWLFLYAEIPYKTVKAIENMVNGTFSPRMNW